MVEHILKGFDKLLMEPTIEFDFAAPGALFVAKDLGQKLIETMLAAPGIGLAANQIGIPLRVFSFMDNDMPRVVFNPVLLGVSSEEIFLEEGCLSFLGLFADISRPKTVKYAWQDIYGNKHESVLSNIVSRIWQHEMDHLNGILFFNRVERITRDKILKEWRKENGLVF